VNPHGSEAAVHDAQSTARSGRRRVDDANERVRFRGRTRRRAKHRERAVAGEFRSPLRITLACRESRRRPAGRDGPLSWLRGTRGRTHRRYLDRIRETAEREVVGEFAAPAKISTAGASGEPWSANTTGVLADQSDGAGRADREEAEAVDLARKLTEKPRRDYEKLGASGSSGS